MRRAADFDPAYALAVVSELQMEYGRTDEALDTLRRGAEAGVRVKNLKADLAARLVDTGRLADAHKVLAAGEQFALRSGFERNVRMMSGAVARVRSAMGYPGESTPGPFSRSWRPS